MAPRRAPRLLLLLLVATLASTAGGSRAGAQGASAPQTALARRLFREGIEAARGGDFQTARRRFARSNQLSPRSVTLLNLAGAEVQTGALVDAGEHYRRYLHMTRDHGDAQRRAVASHALAALQPRIPQVVIHLDHLADSDTIKLDDDPVVHAVLGEGLPVNPGPHRLTVERHGEAILYEEFSVDEGARRDVTYALPRPVDSHEQVATATQAAHRALQADQGEGGERARGGEPGDAGRDEDTGGGLLSSPVFWVVVGALLIAGGVAGYFLLFDESGPQPFHGNLGPGQLSL